MGTKNTLHHIGLSHPSQLQTLVESRRTFNLNNCELSIFESYQETYGVPLAFSDFVITSMVRGKKIMHLDNKPSFDYLPGETVIAPAYELMKIDFPEARMDDPTQCIALTLDGSYIKDALSYLNQYYNSNTYAHHWKLQFNQYHFDNDNEVTSLINKLIRICTGSDKGKNIYADLNIKELLIRLVQSQYLQQITEEIGEKSNHTQLHYLLDYIKDNLSERILINTLCKKAYLNRNDFFRLFKEQFGLSPLEYINHERIKMAKKLLSETNYSIKEISFQCGFTDVNYFVRLFKKKEGITPGFYKQSASFEQ